MLTEGIELPADALLGPVVDALGPANVLETCRRQLGAIDDEVRASWRHCRIVEALYHPGRYIRVAYALLTDASIPTQRNWPEGQIVYLHAPLRPPMSRRGHALTLNGRQVEAYLFPNDRRLRGLRRFASRQAAAQVWRGWMRSAGDDFQMSSETLRRMLIRYVPEQKWIVRLRVRGVECVSCESAKRSIAVRSATKRNCGILARRHLALAEETEYGNRPFHVPRIVGLQMAGGLVATEWIRGKTLLESLASGSTADLMDRIAAVLASFHAMSPAAFAPLPQADVSSRVRDAADDLAIACPTREAAVRQVERDLCRRLDDLEVEQTAVLHNDFHWNQVRIQGDRVTLLDFERMCIGDPVIDIANFATQLRMLGHRPEYDVSPEQADAWAQAFLQSCSRNNGCRIAPDSLACYSALSLLELARGMMRHLRPGWRELADRCIAFARVGLVQAAAESVLS